MLRERVSRLQGGCVYLLQSPSTSGGYCTAGTTSTAHTAATTATTAAPAGGRYAEGDRRTYGRGGGGAAAGDEELKGRSTVRIKRPLHSSASAALARAHVFTPAPAPTPPPAAAPEPVAPRGTLSSADSTRKRRGATSDIENAIFASYQGKGISGVISWAGLGLGTAAVAAEAGAVDSLAGALDEERCAQARLQALLDGVGGPIKRRAV